MCLPGILQQPDCPSLTDILFREAHAENRIEDVRDPDANFCHV